MPPKRQRKQPGADRKVAKWSFGEGKYLSTKSISRNGVSTGESVNTLRGALGMREGVYDVEVRERVLAAQEAAGLAPTGVVTKEDWDAIVNVTTQPRGRRKPKPADDGVTPPVD